jgi:hypothetical protein
MPAGLKNSLNPASGQGLKYILLFLSLFLGLLSFHFRLLSYAEFINLWADFFGVANSLDKIKESFTPYNYLMLKTHTLGLEIILFAALIYLFKKSTKLPTFFGAAINSFSSIFCSIASSLRALSKAQKVLLYSIFVIFMGQNMLLLFYLPFDADEIWLYMAFKNKNPIFTLLWYPIPGNHILYSFLAQSFLQINSSIHYLIRAPAILASGLTFFALFFLLNSLFRFRLALAGLLLFYSFSPIIYYSVAARGYSFNLLCTIILISCVYRIIFYNDKRFMYLGIVASALGIFAIPTFIYNLASVLACWLIFILFYKKSSFKSLLLFWLATIPLSYLLYMPTFIFSGYSAVFKNGYVVSKNMYEIATSFVSHYSHAAAWLISGSTFDFFIILCLIILGLAFVFFTKNTKHTFILLLSIILLILPYGFSMLQRVLIPPAVLCYTCFALCFILVYIFFVLDTLIHHVLLNRLLLFSMLILICLPLHVYFRNFYEERFYRYRHAHHISEFLNGKGRNYFFNDTYYPYIFEFYLARHNALQTINLTQKSYAADVITIWKKENALKFVNSDKKYSLIYDDSTTTIYKKLHHE